jgi:hypothetical protein
MVPNRVAGDREAEEEETAGNKEAEETPEQGS